jgi:hypothetical protein
MWLTDVAWAEDGGCADGGLETGFSTANPRPGDLGTGFRPCARDSAGLALGGSLVADTANFYGSIGAGATIEGSKVLGDWRLHGSVEVVRLDMLISAFSSNELGFGHTMIGVQRALVTTDHLLVLADARVVLPTTSALYKHVRPFAGDLGVGVDLAATDWLRFHGHLAGLGSFALSAGPAGPWGGLDLRVGGEARAGHVFAFVLDLDGTYGYAGGSGLEGIVAAPALRFGVGRLGLELDGWMPLVTTKRQPLAVELRATWRFAGA